jgi:hypothetical protein
MHEAYYHRKQVAERDLGATRVSPPVARWLVFIFAMGLGLTALEQLMPPPAADRKPAPVEQAREVQPFGSEKPAEGWWPRLLSANRHLSQRLESLERQMEQQLWPVRAFRGLQPALVSWFGLSTESVCPGSTDWLFYKPDLDHLMARGFLELQEKRPGESVPERHRNPIPAILDFHEQLSSRGIQLFVMPIPVKASIHPEKFTSWSTSGLDHPLTNRSFASFTDSMKRSGVVVIDVAAEMFQDARQNGDSQFLQTDTHWTPDAMIRAADQITGMVKDSLDSDGPRQSWTSQPTRVRGRGDLAGLLGGDSVLGFYPDQTVTVRRIVSADGMPWSASSGEIVLLGDSFSNIYSMPEMNWGDSAGLAEQLSYSMQRPVDRLVQNHEGAFATRLALSRAMTESPQRFAKTKVVVWQFSARELSFGDWRPIPLPDHGNSLQRSQASPDPIPSDGNSSIRVLAVGSLPRPGTVPYRDALVAWEVELPTEAGGPPLHCVVYVWGMKDNRLQPAAEVKPGQRLTLRLTEWHQVEERYGRFARAELDDPEWRLLTAPIYFGELME